MRFNPRTREGCDPVFVSIAVDETVSIHAPARGATKLPAYLFASCKFQSTHPRGVRHALL